MADLLLQRQDGTAKIMARAQVQGMGHERPQKNRGEGAHDTQAGFKCWKIRT